MKRKRKAKRQPQRTPIPEKNRYLLPFLLFSLVPGGFMLANLYHLSARIVIPPVMILLWVAGSMLLWQWANAHATGHEWWQEDDR